jgi:hypothetical protein
MKKACREVTEQVCFGAEVIGADTDTVRLSLKTRGVMMRN